MLGRLQLANGYVAGTLSKEEKKVAEANPLVMSQVEALRNVKPIPSRRTKYARSQIK